jgi:hypothetical protein
MQNDLLFKFILRNLWISTIRQCERILTNTFKALFTHRHDFSLLSDERAGRFIEPWPLIYGLIVWFMSIEAKIIFRGILL